jgi:hypothetical protein
MAKKTKLTKRRNLVAKDLRTPKYRMRVVESKKLYTRKTIKFDGEQLNGT